MQEGLMEAAQRRPDVILLDNNMGGMSGVEAVPLIKANAPSPCTVSIARNNFRPIKSV